VLSRWRYLARSKVLSKAHMIGAICSRGRIVWQMRPHMSRSVDGVLGVVWIDLKMIRGEKNSNTKLMLLGTRLSPLRNMVIESAGLYIYYSLRTAGLSRHCSTQALTQVVLGMLYPQGCVAFCQASRDDRCDYALSYSVLLVNLDALLGSSLLHPTLGGSCSDARGALLFPFQTGRIQSRLERPGSYQSSLEVN
jgi:hypothetical protein